MTLVEHAIDVDVPVSVAYNQWTQFEEFPHFMNDIEEIRQLDDKRLFWRANIMGMPKEWYAEIVEQLPDQRIAWRSEGGANNAGVVTFHRLNDTMTRIMLQMEYKPEGFIENVGDTFGVIERRMKDDMERFKTFIEKRGTPSGAWRGEVI